MKSITPFKPIVYIAIALLVGLTSCVENSTEKKTEIALNDTSLTPPPAMAPQPASDAFKKYWYAGTAEITSYEIQEARYGELRSGNAVLIYVTEPFLPGKQVKADRSNSGNVPVLKLNRTKKYLTGIYPYSIMGSTFYPIADNQHAIKVSASVQEWCGHVYAQINNRDRFEITSHSYFESEADQNLQLEKAILENEIWNKIRINPENLPLGKLKMIPSLEYIRLRHGEFKAYDFHIALRVGKKQQKADMELQQKHSHQQEQN